ncbi:hypothetical protein [Oceanicaulis alexandrii]|uniref:hypothetical protein n=1 Tax=Oceanicaulis alexandrii TaxID=153233 RepID=UPI0003B73AFB|nr:hypothetical protein [Oceanicaulis alexandrii]VXC97037.1 conserved hypothetical protein [Oceanicaulis sp. 350]
MSFRLIILAIAAITAIGGLLAGALSLMGGALDQAVAFTWPGLAGAVALALIAPGRPAK